MIGLFVSGCIQGSKSFFLYNSFLDMTDNLKIPTQSSNDSLATGVSCSSSSSPTLDVRKYTLGDDDHHDHDDRKKSIDDLSGE
jgi:hypothetical protein